MFNQLQELQRQKNPQELDDPREQNVISQLSLTRDKQSSGAQFGLLNNGVRVRDPSQMFMFGDANWFRGFSNRLADSRLQSPSHESAGLLIKNRSQQAGIFGKSLTDDHSSGSVKHKLPSKEGDNSLGTASFKNMFVKTEDSSHFRSIQSGSSSDIMQSAVAEASSGDQKQTSCLVKNGNQTNPWPYNKLPHSHFETPKTGNCAGMSGFIDKSPTLSAPNSSPSGNMYERVHKVDKEHTYSVSVNEMPISKSDDAFTPSYDDNNPSHSPHFGLRLTTQSQRPLPNYLDPYRISQQTDHFTKPSQSPKSEINQLSNQNHMKFHLVSVMKEDGQSWSTGPASIRLDAPMQQNHSELPSTSYAANSRVIHPSSFHVQQLDLAYEDTATVKSKKRKFSSFEHLPWHEEATEGFSRLHDISTAEPEWAHTMVQVPENLEQLAEERVDLCWIIERKRRLCLTTQLMQLLFHLPPAVVLSEDAFTHYDTVTYYASKLALDDACGLCSPAGKNMTSESSSDQDLVKVIEGFIDRSRRLEDDVSRLEKGEPLILEVMMGFQDLEKFSFINRFAKFHTGRAMVTGDVSSSAKRKQNPQRYVKASPMPKMVPEGQNCVVL